MKRILIFIILLSGVISQFELKCQSHAVISSLSEISSFVDTVEQKLNHTRVARTWMNDTIELSILANSIKYDTSIIRKMKRDSTYVPTAEEVVFMSNFLRTAGQNCYSDALQRYFSYKNIYADDLFRSNTKLATMEDMEKIIDASFHKTSEFSTKRKRMFKNQLKDGTLIIFRNKYDWISHTLYYEKGIYYSKNGASPLKEYNRLKDVFKVYWDTLKIQFYEMDHKKINDFLIQRS